MINPLWFYRFQDYISTVKAALIKNWSALECAFHWACQLYMSSDISQKKGSQNEAA